MREDFVRTLRFWADRGVDGFRIDVAHMLTKDLTEPLPSKAELDARPKDGSHPVIDRDDVHEIYAQWRAVFNEYDPPRTAVAEAWVERSRRPRYASAEGLGQAFNFDLLEADFDAAQFRDIVTDNLELAARVGLVDDLGAVEPRCRAARDPLRPAAARSATRTAARCVKHGNEWLLSRGASPGARPRARARAARAPRRCSCSACPARPISTRARSSGLHEVAELDDADRQDPTFFRSPGIDVGRDGCRVPLPWTATGARSASARTARICRSRSGSARSRSRRRMDDPARCCRSTAGRCLCGTGCRCRRARVGRHGSRRRAVVPPAGRMGGGDELRLRAVPARRATTCAHQLAAARRVRSRVRRRLAAARQVS